MAMTECGHGHIYDSDVYASCPYCNSTQPVINFTAPAGGQGGYAAYDQNKTQPIQGGFGPMGGSSPAPGGYAPNGGQYDVYSSSSADPGRTMPIGGMGGQPGQSVCDANETRPPRGYRQERRADEEQKTVGDMKQKYGLEPVVGWLVASTPSAAARRTTCASRATRRSPRKIMHASAMIRRTTASV